MYHFIERAANKNGFFTYKLVELSTERVTHVGQFLFAAWVRSGKVVGY